MQTCELHSEPSELYLFWKDGRHSRGACSGNRVIKTPSTFKSWECELRVCVTCFQITIIYNLRYNFALLCERRAVTVDQCSQSLRSNRSLWLSWELKGLAEKSYNYPHACSNTNMIRWYWVRTVACSCSLLLMRLESTVTVAVKPTSLLVDMNNESILPSSIYFYPPL